MKIERVHISVFIAAVAVTWMAVVWVRGVHVSSTQLMAFAGVVGPLSLLGLVLERWLWRCRWLHGWLIKRPDLRGTWRVELESSYVRPGMEERVSMIVCYMGVRQTLSTLQMHLMTPESESWLVASNVRPARSGRGFELTGVYSNEPQLVLRNARVSEIHRGAINLNTHGDSLRPDQLTAEYWTDRMTNGKMTFGRRVDQICTRYQDARCAFSDVHVGDPAQREKAGEAG